MMVPDFISYLMTGPISKGSIILNLFDSFNSGIIKGNVMGNCDKVRKIS